mgnify:CR=1 FL=1
MAANGQLVFTDVDKVTFKGVGNTSNAVIDTITGKLGVGVDSPDANLHIIGNCFVSTDLTASTLSGNGSGLTALNATNITTGTLTAARIPVLDAAKITSGTLPVTRGGTGATGSSTGTGGVVLSAAPAFTGDVTFDTDTLKIDSTNNRVGIGTTSPQGQLHISSGNSGDCVLKIEADEDNNNEYDNPRIEFITDGGYNTALVGAGQMPFETANDNALVLAAYQMKFYTGIQDFTDSTNMTECMRIDVNGNVGIGVTSPDNKLEVRGTIQASQSDVDHGMIIDKGGTVRRDYGGNGAGLHFTGNEIWPTNYAGSYSNGGIDLGNASYRWNNVYTEALNANGIVTATNLDLDGTVIRSAANITLTADTWNKIADFSSFTTGGYYLISIKWSNSTYVSTGATCIWYGGATYSTYVVGGSVLYNATGQENITYNANVHYRVIDPFLFIQDSDASAGSYGKHSIYMKSPQSSVVANSVAVVAYRIS